MPDLTAIKEKVRELAEVLKAEGLWKPHEPVWVTSYRDGDEAVCKADFFEWLQFVYLPNLISEESHYSYAPKQSYLAPQAIRFFGPEAERTKLLQLLVELDALTN